MLKKTLFIYFIFFSLCLLHGEEDLEQITVEWKDILEEEITLFVNNTNRSKEKANGSKKAPFKTLEQAFTHLSGLKKKNIKALIYITGSFTSKNVYIVKMPTKIVGFDDYKTKAIEKKTSSYINFEKNAGFVVTSSKLFIEQCTISRKELIDEPRSVPILYSSNSLINIKNVTITAKEGGSIFRFIESDVSMEEMILNSVQNGYCNIMQTIKSKLKIKATNFNCDGRFVVLIDSTDSLVSVENVHCNILAHLSAVALKANNGDVSVENSFFSAEGKYAQKDDAIICDEKTKLHTKNVILKGFMRESNKVENTSES